MGTSKVIPILLVGIVIVSLIIVSGCTGNTFKDCKMITKTKTVNEKNCEYTTGCGCVHKSWGGLGQCDSCMCEYQEEVCE